MILSTCNCFRNSICCRRKETPVRIIKSILLPQQDSSPRIVLPYHITTQIYTTTSCPCTLAGRRPYLLMSTQASLFHTRLSVSVNNGGNKKYYGHTMSSHHGHCVQCVCLINLSSLVSSEPQLKELLSVILGPCRLIPHLHKSLEFLINVSYRAITGSHQLEWGEDVAYKKVMRILS